MGSGLKAFLREKDVPAWQVAKYVICGGMSVAIDQLTFYLLAWLAFPALRLTDPAARFLTWVGCTIREVGEDTLENNYWIIKGFCFLISNAAVYILNILFVFKVGRHRKLVEILLFFGSSLFQFFFIWLGGWLITRWSWEVTYANLTMLLAAMAVNFIIRKKLVFKG